MSVVALLLDKARERRSIASDNALASRMGKSRQTISQWRSGTRHPTDDDVLALCAMAATDCAEWLAKVAAERATSAPVAKAWESLARRLGAAASLAAVALPFLQSASASQVATASGLLLTNAVAGCIMRIRQGLRVAASVTRHLFRSGHAPAPVLA